MSTAVYTRQGHAATVLDRWRRTYTPARLATYDEENAREKRRIAEELAALPTPVDPNAVDAIIGNKTWTEVAYCDVCESEPDAILFLDIGDDHFPICRSCLLAALALFPQETP